MNAIIAYSGPWKSKKMHTVRDVPYNRDASTPKIIECLFSGRRDPGAILC